MNSRSGLTLFELLVSLALLALIAAGLANALGLAVTLWDRSAAYTSSSQEVILRTRLRIWLQNATPPSRLTPFPTVFSGTETNLSFVTLSSTPFAPKAAATRITLTAANDTLSMTVAALNDEGNEISVIERNLAENIIVTFEYYSTLSEPAEWRPTWQSEHQLPTLIRISAPEGSTPEWPDFVVGPLLE